MRSSMRKAAVAVTLTAALGASAPAAVLAAETGSGLGSIVNCDASGNRQAKGALIGALAGAAIGNNVSGSKDAPLVGGLAGAAAGSYIGCQQQRTKAARQGLGAYTARSTVNVRSGPSTRHARVGQLRPGDQVRVTGWEGNWARVRFAGGDASGYVSASYLSPS